MASQYCGTGGSSGSPSGAAESGRFPERTGTGNFVGHRIVFTTEAAMSTLLVLLFATLTPAAVLLGAGLWMVKKLQGDVGRALGVICIVFGLLLVIAAVLLVLLVQTSTEEELGVTEPNLQASQAPRHPTPPLPQAFLEYDDRQYRGWRGSYCWPVGVSSIVCSDSVGWEGFDKASSVVVERGSGFKIVTSESAAPEQVRVEVFAALGTEPFMMPREEPVYSIDVQEIPALDLPTGVYYVSAFFGFHFGDVAHGFKVEIAE